MKKLISDYQIFFELRDMYPKFIELIAEIMRFAFDNQDSFHQVTYLKGTFAEDDVRFIFSKLNLKIVSVINAKPRSEEVTIINFDFDEKISLVNAEKP